jgi:hypothetical protein
LFTSISYSFLALKSQQATTMFISPSLYTLTCWSHRHLCFPSIIYYSFIFLLSCLFSDTHFPFTFLFIFYLPLSSCCALASCSVRRASSHPPVRCLLSRCGGAQWPCDCKHSNPPTFSRSQSACLEISGMKGNEGYWGGGISIISQNFLKSPSILFHPLDSSVS